MALPSFSKTLVTTMSFSRGDAFPRRRPGEERQLVGRSEGGVVRIATLSDPEEFIVLDFAQRTSLPSADYVNLGVFLRDPLIHFKGYPFTFTDTDASTTLCRYWAGYYDFAQTAYGLYQGTLTLRIEA